MFPIFIRTLSFDFHTADEVWVIWKKKSANTTKLEIVL